MTQEKQLLSQCMKKLISLDKLEDLKQEIGHILDDFLDKKITHKDLYELVEFIQNNITNVEHRDLLLYEIFNFPKIMEYPNELEVSPVWFSRLCDIYANEPEKIFGILKTNFRAFIRKMYSSEVNGAPELTIEKSQESYRQALMHGPSNIPAEVLFIFLTFPKLVFPIADISHYNLSENEYRLMSDEDISNYHMSENPYRLMSNEDYSLANVPQNYVIPNCYQDELNHFNKMLTERLVAVLEKDESNELSGDVLLAIVRSRHALFDERLKELAKERLRFLLKEDNVTQDVLRAIEKEPGLNYVEDFKKLASKNLCKDNMPLTFMRAMLKDSEFSKKIPKISGPLDSAVVMEILQFYSVTSRRRF